MKVTINGKKQEVTASINLEELLLNLGLEKGAVAVELNKRILKRDKYRGTILNEDDSLEIVHLVGGG